MTASFQRAIRAMEFRFNRDFCDAEYSRATQAARDWVASARSSADGIKGIWRISSHTLRLRFEGTIHNQPGLAAQTQVLELGLAMCHAINGRPTGRDQVVELIQVESRTYEWDNQTLPVNSGPQVVPITHYRFYRLPKRPWDKIAARCTGQCDCTKTFRWDTDHECYRCVSCGDPLSIVYTPLEQRAVTEVAS